MGMFDYVSIEPSMLPCSADELADLEFEGFGFQTKSFQRPTLSTYDITPPIEPGGCQLFMTSSDWHGRTVEERVECEPVKFTGVVSFYADGASGKWYEFDAFFTDGVLDKIERNKPREELYSR